jgi:hypothetical protein
VGVAFSAQQLCGVPSDTAWGPAARCCCCCCCFWRRRVAAVSLPAAFLDLTNCNLYVRIE